jgi:hypothetical protein
MNTAVKIGMRDYIKEIGAGAIGKSINGIRQPRRKKKARRLAARAESNFLFRRKLEETAQL